MKQTYKLIFIALLLIGLCVSGVQATATWINPTMTNNTSPYGVASASSEYDSPYRAYMNFNHVTNELGWQANTTKGWLQYRFQYSNGTDYRVIVTAINVTAPSTSFLNRAPKAWTVKATNTGAFSGEKIT